MLAFVRVGASKRPGARGLAWVCVLACAVAPACRRDPPQPPAQRSPAPSPSSPTIRLPAVELEVGDGTPLGLILISVDTLRADYLSCYGHTRILTPNIDRLAAGGVLFRHAYSQASTTTPSHASMLTSLYLQDHNVFSNFEALGDGPITMAEAFAAHGYSTYGIVTMRHLNPEVSNLGQGFQHFVRSTSTRRAGPTIDNFLSWVDGTQGKPFFAFIHLTDVHTPYRPPPPYDRFYYDDDEHDPSEKSLARIWPTLPKHMSDHPFFQQWLQGITDLAYVLAQYQGAVTYVDDEIGRLLDALEERDLLHRTAIVFTADHGESLGEHGMYFVHTGLYEPTVHVPFIGWFPGMGEQGVQVRDIVESVDIMPTVLEYFGLHPPEALRGRSLWPLIRGEALPPKSAFIEHAGRNLVAMRSEHYKYIRHLRTAFIQPSYPFIDGREELYDLRTDPRELHDIAKEHPDVLAAFRQEIERRRTERLNLAVGKAEITPETTDILRSLGYVE